MSDKPEKLQELLTQGFITEQEYQSRLAALTANSLSLNADANQQSLFPFTMSEPKGPNAFTHSPDIHEPSDSKNALETAPTAASSLSWGSSIGTSSFKIIVMGDGGIGKTVTLFIFTILTTAFTDKTATKDVFKTTSDWRV